MSANPDTKKCVGIKIVSPRQGHFGQMCQHLAVAATCRQHVGNFLSQALCVALRSAASCKPSPSNTGIMHPSDDGWVKGHAGGGGLSTRSGYGVGQYQAEAENKVKYHGIMHHVAPIVLWSNTQGKDWAMQAHSIVLPPCNFIAWFATWEQIHCKSLQHWIWMGGGESYYNIHS